MSEEGGSGHQTSLDESLMLRKQPGRDRLESMSDRGSTRSVDDMGLPTPLRAAWGPAFKSAPHAALDPGWELPSITLATQDRAAAVRRAADDVIKYLVRIALGTRARGIVQSRLYAC